MFVCSCFGVFFLPPMFTDSLLFTLNTSNRNSNTYTVQRSRTRAFILIITDYQPNGHQYECVRRSIEKCINTQYGLALNSQFNSAHVVQDRLASKSRWKLSTWIAG